MATRHMVDKALKANKDHQYALKVYTERLEAELASVDKLISAADSFDDSSEESLGIIRIPGAKKPVSLVPLSGFLSEDSPFYEDATWRNTYEDRTTINPMKAKDHEQLAEAVRTENKRLYALEAQRRGEPVTDKLPEHPPSYWEQNTEGLDWKRIATRFTSTSALPSRTPDELRIRWIGHAHPKFSHGPWALEETERVRQIVSEMLREGSNVQGSAMGVSRPRVDWVKVAEALGTNRTPLDCVRHAIPRRTHIWTPESDMKLLEAVNAHGGNNWSPVALAISPDATAHACQKRYTDTLDPSLKRGPWSADEDTRLLRAIAGFWQPGTATGTNISRNGSFGNEETDSVVDDETPIAGPSNQRAPAAKTRPSMKAKTTNAPIPWPDVAAFVPGRNNNQCRERYNILISSANKGKERLAAAASVGMQDSANVSQKQAVNRSRWTKDEDDRLACAVVELGAESDKSKWAEVAERVGNGRGWAVCKKRYEKLKKAEQAPSTSISHPASFRVNLDTSASRAPDPAPEMPNVREPVMTAATEIRFIPSTLGDSGVNDTQAESTSAEAPREEPARPREPANGELDEHVLSAKGKGKGKSKAIAVAEAAEPASTPSASKKGKSRGKKSTSKDKSPTKSKTSKAPASKPPPRRPRPAYRAGGGSDRDEAAETEVEGDEEDDSDPGEVEPEVASTSARPLSVTSKAPASAAKKRKRTNSRNKRGAVDSEDGDEGKEVVTGARKRQKRTASPSIPTVSKRSTRDKKGPRSSARGKSDGADGVEATDTAEALSIANPVDVNEDQVDDDGMEQNVSGKSGTSATRTVVVAESGRRRSTRIALKK